MRWLQGGPFLELSFIFNEPTEFENVISKLNNTNVKIEVHNSPEYIQQFYEGYPFDEDDPHSAMIHRIEINLTVNTARQRRALLFVEKISSDLISFSMCFFGSIFDAPEWNQPGIRDDELDEFILLLISLYRELKFSVGGLAFEEDIKGLFDVNEAWPNEKYNFVNLNFKDNLHKFQAILIDQSLNEKLPEGQFTMIDNSCKLYRNVLNKRNDSVQSFLPNTSQFTKFAKDVMRNDCYTIKGRRDMKNSNELLPRDKHDFERVITLKELDKKELETIIPDLLEWLQDMNWPISEAISKLLLTVPGETLPYVFEVLRGHDDIWKEWCLRCFVLELPLELMKNFEEETRRIAFEPTKGELLEEVHLTALEILGKLQST